MAFIASAAAAPCPAANDSATLVLGGKVYRYIEQGLLTYDQVRAECAAMDSYPIVFNTWTEQLEVEAYFDYHQNLEIYWIGLRQVGNNGVW